MQSQQTIAKDIRIVSVTSTTSYQTLRALIDTALAAKSAPATTFPNTDVIQVAITPSANLLVRDSITQDDLTLGSGIRFVFPVEDCLEKIVVKNAATVLVEVYFGE